MFYEECCRNKIQIRKICVFLNVLSAGRIFFFFLTRFVVDDIEPLNVDRQAGNIQLIKGSKPLFSALSL